MRYSVEFTDTAKSDLRDIALFIVEEAKNKDVAKKFVKELTDKCLILEEFPLTGAMPKDRMLVSSGYRFLVHKDYLIFYTVEEAQNKIYVQAVFNAKKDYTRVLRKLI